MYFLATQQIVPLALLAPAMLIGYVAAMLYNHKRQASPPQTLHMYVLCTGLFFFFIGDPHESGGL